jgi:hypothetical protein
MTHPGEVAIAAGGVDHDEVTIGHLRQGRIETLFFVLAGRCYRIERRLLEAHMT